MAEICRFTFTCAVTEKDAARAVRAQLRTHTWVWAIWIGFGAYVAYVLLFDLLSIWQGTRTPLSLGRHILVFTATAVLMWGMYWLPPLWAMRGSPAAGAEEEISLFDDRIVIQSRLGRDELLWAHFRKVDETAEFFLLQPHEGNVYPVPKRHFANAADLDWFRHWIRRHISDFHQH